MFLMGKSVLKFGTEGRRRESEESILSPGGTDSSTWVPSFRRGRRMENMHL